MIHVKQVVQDFIILNICQEKEKGKKDIDSTDRGLVWATVSPWLYQSRAVAKRRPETDAARVILWPIPIRGQYWIYFNPISFKFVILR